MLTISSIFHSSANESCCYHRLCHPVQTYSLDDVYATVEQLRSTRTNYTRGPSSVCPSVFDEQIN